MPRVLEQYGIQERRGGWCLCPFHHEDTPSLKVYPASFYCFGCGAGGDVITFVARLFNLGNRAAAEKICMDFGLPYLRTPPSAGAVRYWRQQESRRRKEQQELDEYRQEYNRRTEEAQRLRLRPKPEGGPENPKWGEYAAAMARLEYLDAWFEQNVWR